MFICCPHPSGLAEIRAAAHGTWLHLEHADRGETTPLTNYMNSILFSFFFSSSSSSSSSKKKKKTLDTTSLHPLLATLALYVSSSALLLCHFPFLLFRSFFFSFPLLYNQSSDWSTFAIAIARNQRFAKWRRKVQRHFPPRSLNTVWCSRRDPRCDNWQRNAPRDTVI